MIKIRNLESTNSMLQNDIKNMCAKLALAQAANEQLASTHKKEIQIIEENLEKKYQHEIFEITSLNSMIMEEGNLPRKVLLFRSQKN